MMCSAKKVKKGSKPRLTEWACSEGCDVSRTICEHLEKHLPQMRDGDMPRFVTSESAASSSVSFHNTVFWAHSEPDFIALMKNYGFTEQWDLDLLSAKYFKNWSSKDIADEFGYVSERTVRYRLAKLREQLEERGFKQELE